LRCALLGVAGDEELMRKPAVLGVGSEVIGEGLQNLEGDREDGV